MIERDIELNFRHRVLFTRSAFDRANADLVDLLNDGSTRPVRVMFVVDGHVAEKRPGLEKAITSYFESHSDKLKLAGPILSIPGGESCKNDFSLVQGLWKEINDVSLDRHSYVVAIGGGAVLDLVGFAAATAHRGVRHLRFPTTTLSQGDGGVGVKNGVNYFGKKNWVGSFSVPHAVVNDFDFLDTLSEVDRRAGLIEAIKVALIRDADFFSWIAEHTSELASLDTSAIEYAIEKSAELHVEHIATSGDPFELGSARPLDFGHWVAHKLEQLSNFRIGHGEAVAIGMAVDLLYSAEVGILDPEICDRILWVIRGIGFPVAAPELFENGKETDLAILDGLEEFREHLGGELTITLVPEIGQKLEVNTMDHDALRIALAALKVADERS